MGCSRVLLILSWCLMSNTFAKDCNRGWMSFGEHCYFLSSEAMNWNNARIECKKLGGWLADIESAAENDWLTLQAFFFGKTLWVGGTDGLSEGDWRWEKTGKVIAVNGWGKNEPGGQTKENCLILLFRDKSKWHDVTCNASFAMVCKKRKQETFQRHCFTKCCH